ncbi:GATA zinc finger domain-containing protein 10-like isoform X2 [Panonychus citri]|uniref:GATA zinc finger domain-containing protein 10-like isoform X2 n=1 Tax=Panonychus citri TaxID=50023 RepID=UPI002306DF28|nr:GATA zinc finger domain-containing protein 10-like isoform X2 [Panonychus citri]XP_053200977.1 GATA zinc finger domain-containing protein 10-like isoform X2 [Panonychus citri]XP_053215019.1 GATA zinc finger domain-containing protein 10-like isoform X2 [Panonychus citri]XP_053215020.1 GATA zinc finger domain-containing protein 10-like isoform X2 [Panonychus citri]
MVVCKYYQTGFCRFGDRCRFEHVDRDYPNNQNQRYPEQYVNRFPGSTYINNPVATVVTGIGSGYNQRGPMVALKKPDQYHYVASVYDRQFQPNCGQSFNHQSRPQHGHTGHSGNGGANTNNGTNGLAHQSHHPHQQQHGIIPVQYWQVQQQQQQQQQVQQQQRHHQHQQQQQQQQRHQQMQSASLHHHHQSHSSNQRQTQVGHHGQGQSGGHPGPSGSGVQHHQQSAGFSFNQKLKEIESSQKPQAGFSFNRTLQQIHQQYQPHLAQQAQNQYYLTPTPMLTVPVQTPYYGVTMPMPMAANQLAPMFPSMLPTNNGDPKMITSYLPQQQSTQGKISMNLSDDDSGIYSIMSSLTPEELNQYKADKFTFPHIPINPPPKELCL